MKLKPYDLVAVSMNDGQYNIIGQVMSFKTPEDTIMVRMVPDHPGTLQEIALSRVSPIREKSRSGYKVCYAVVKGMGQFPEDMLRYDHAVPVNFKIEDDWTGPKAKIEPGTGEAMIIATVAARHARPEVCFCADRWASFLWSLKPLKDEVIIGSAS